MFLLKDLILKDLLYHCWKIGKQVPTIDLLSKICSLTGTSADDYFVESTTDALVYLMGSLEESDKLKIEEMAERIRIKEKYEMLAKRGSYVVD